MEIIRKLCGLLVVSCLVSPAVGSDATPADPVLTFFGWSDQHVQTDGDAAHLNPAIDAMNKLPGTPFPKSIGGEVAKPAFVFGCGDITEWPTHAAMKAYDQLITKRLRFPAYDILGNHDEGGKEPSETMRKWIISRHGSPSYTFEHGGVHFIALFSKYNESLNHPAQPLTDEAFDFLRTSLSKLPAGSPVIIATHLCFDAITNRDALCDVIGDANVIAILGGHYHKAKVDKYRGRHFIQLPSPAPGSPDEITVVRITSNRLLAIPYDCRQGKWSDDPKKRLNVEIRGPTTSTPTEDDFLRIDFDLGRGDGIFLDEGGMPIAVQLSNASPAAVSGITRWEIKSDEGTTVATANVSTVIPGQGETRVTSSYRPGMPGFYRVTCEFRGEAKEGVKSSMTLGYRPEEIQATTTNQKDFDEFWKEALESLAAVDPQFQMTRHPEMDTETHEVYKVEMRSLGDVRVRGWYERPLAAGRFPAMLRVPGYGGNMKPTGSKELMAILSFNIRGHGNSQEDVPGDPKNYWIRGLDQKQDYFYLGAYADCVRAVDFLVSRPEVDSGRIVVTGGSQGGGLSLATAGLDPRISLCAPDIPFLCDWVKYFKASHWPEMNAWVEAESDRSWATTLRTLSYFDTLNMADRIRCPVFLGVGLQDEVCPAATIFAVYNRLRGPKEYHVYPTAGHSVGASHHQKRRDWIREHLQKN